MDIGTEQETITVEPLEDPVPARETEPAEPVEVPAPERETVPANLLIEHRAPLEQVSHRGAASSRSTHSSEPTPSRHQRLAAGIKDMELRGLEAVQTSKEARNAEPLRRLEQLNNKEAS